MKVPLEFFHPVTLRLQLVTATLPGEFLLTLKTGMQRRVGGGSASPALHGAGECQFRGRL